MVYSRVRLYVQTHSQATSDVLNAPWTFGSNSGRLPESNKRKQLTAQQKDLEGFDNKRVDNYYFRFGLPDETWN